MKSEIKYSCFYCNKVKKPEKMSQIREFGINAYECLCNKCYSTLGNQNNLVMQYIRQQKTLICTQRVIIPGFGPKDRTSIDWWF